MVFSTKTTKLNIISSIFHWHTTEWNQPSTLSLPHFVNFPFIVTSQRIVVMSYYAIFSCCEWWNMLWATHIFHWQFWKLQVEWNRRCNQIGLRGRFDTAQIIFRIVMDSIKITIQIPEQHTTTWKYLRNTFSRRKPLNLIEIGDFLEFSFFSLVIIIW